MITVSGELLSSLPQGAASYPVDVNYWPADGACNILGNRESTGAFRGTIHVTPSPDKVDVTQFGKPTDCVRLIVSANDRSRSDAAESCSSERVIGFIRLDCGWVENPVQVVPIREELFSRSCGLIETAVLSDKRVFQAGLGSGGMPDLVELAKAGVMKFDVMDHDRLEVGNIGRHEAGLSHVGRLKTNYAAHAIHEKNPFAEIQTWPSKVSWENVELIQRLVHEADLVICATDTQESRVILNTICVAEDTPLIIGGAFRRAYGGQVLRIRPRKSLCYQCFLEAMPQKARDLEVSNASAAERIAYSDRPVPIEPGLSTDIAPISQMVSKLAIQELLRGKETTLDSLNEDLVAPWYLWLNRRERDTDYENLEPLEFNVGGMHVLRWYGVAAERNPACPTCGDFEPDLARRHGFDLSQDDSTSRQGTSKRGSIMAAAVTTFDVSELPDAEYPKYRAVAGRDVRAAVWSDCEQLLRVIASFHPGSVTCQIRFIYRPDSQETDPQSRLRLQVTISGEDDSTVGRLAALVRHGPLSRFYRFRDKSVDLPFPAAAQSVWDVVRRADLVRPLFEPEFNPNIPERYFAIRPFKANEKNDYLVLDQALGNLSEAVDIVIRVEPVDISELLFAHTRYLAQLHSVNRWRDSVDAITAGIDYLGDGEEWHPASQSAVVPLRHRDPLADDLLRAQQRFHETLHKPNLLFQIRIRAERPATAHLVASVVGESAFAEGSYELLGDFDDEQDSSDLARLNDAGARVIPVVDAPLRKLVAYHQYESLVRLISIGTVEELRAAVRLPVASEVSPCCIPKNTDPPPVDVDDLCVLGHDQQSCPGRGVPRGIPKGNLVKHLVIPGLPGTGKTTANFNLLIQLGAIGTAFLVLETAKTEYRALKALKSHRDATLRRLGEELRIYTVGAESVSPVRHNPLEVADGVGIDEKVDTLVACFQAAMSSPGPVQPLTAEALERVYATRKWTDCPPVIADLVSAANEVLREKAYSGDTGSDIRAALEVRLNSLARRSIGRVFQCRRSVPTTSQLVQSQSVVELDRLPVDQRCLLCLFLLTAIRDELKSQPRTDVGLRMAIVIEEAHNVVGRNTDAQASADIADPKSHAAEYVCRMLAELRALGVAIIIVDQLPSAVAPEVIKNTASKLAFRLVANDDRADLGGTMLFTETEFEEIARLRTGEAFFSTEGYFGPRRIDTINIAKELALPSYVSDRELADLIRNEAWFVDEAEERHTIELSQLREYIDDFDRKRLQITRRFAQVSARFVEIIAARSQEGQHVALAHLRETAQTLKQELLAAHQAFLRGPSRMLRPVGIADAESGVNPLHSALIRRFEIVIEPGVMACVHRIDGLVLRMRELRRS